MESKDKKPFKETKFGKFLNKAKDNVPEILTVAGKIATGNIGGAIEEVGDILRGKSEANAEVQKLLIEFEKEKMNFEKDLYELEVRDRESARNREVEIAKTGRTDWMMYLTGIVALISFLTMIAWAIFGELDGTREKIFYHILGFVEGTALSVFTYYFGSSKGSKDKTDLLGK